MIFLIEYDRQKGRLIKFEKFRSAQRVSAEAKKLEIELTLNRKKISHEVVLLESGSEDTLRRTHRRYFESLRALANSAGSEWSLSSL